MVTMEKRQHAFERLERVGGHPALDFVNTVDRWENGRPGNDYLVDYAALAGWHAATGLLDARALRRLEAGSGAAKRNAWQQATGLRNALYRLFAALAAERPVPQKDLDALQRAQARTGAWRRMSAKGRTIVVDWNFEGAPPNAILGPVAWAAAALLERGPLDRIKACPPGDGCSWLFLDLSKNRSRTWCSMKTCGNVAKVRRFRARRP
jgi:predicted RNA-binding Zn ribbon-like protein